ncbi:hypothetical protein GCM10023196_028710 [Actinoallomurus vinaceus]|uniref:non-specific serine/threonine protein kinase n=1 Tax=Actinoallomurus vinaceus TaxID=1080074 RepID=A0ABP8U6W2_9ACTN
MPNTTPLYPDDPRQVGDIRLTGRVGEGGQGIVYRGEASDGAVVVVKLLRGDLWGDDAARDRFMWEAELAMQVARFCTAGVLSAGMAGDRPYIVSEYIDGPSLQRRVASEGVLTDGALERLAIGTATALTAIHHAGIVHRDFKPANVILGPDGPRVIDFGIARALDTTRTATQGVVGTPSYMAPERFSGAGSGPAADVFAWAATVVYAATGRPPFGDDAIPAVLNRILNESPDLTGLREPVCGLVESCLAKDPARRPSARQVLLRLLGGAESPAATALDRSAAGNAAERTAAGKATDRPAADAGRTTVVPVPAAVDGVPVPAAPNPADTADRVPASAAPTSLDIPLLSAAAEFAAADTIAGSAETIGNIGGLTTNDAAESPRRSAGPRRSRLRKVLIPAAVAVAASGAVLAANAAESRGSSPARATTGAPASPAPGSPARPADAAPVRVPEIAGLSENAAAARLRGAGLTMGRVTVDCAASRRKTVLRAAPAAGTTAAAHTPVDVVVGGTPVTVLDGKGWPVAQARKVLEGNGLHVTLERRRSDYWIGKVVAQQPAAGTRACPGSDVTLFVGVG